jgi:hypothetical protein
MRAAQVWSHVSGRRSRALGPGVACVHVSDHPLVGTRRVELDPSELWEAMAFGIGSILDGWGNRDMDIGAFSSATTAAGQPSWLVQILPYIEQLD